MEISRVPVSKSLGNCEHLYNQMSSESLREFEKVRKRLPQSHAGGSARFLWQHFIKDRGLYTGHHAVHQTRLFLPPADTREAKAMFNLCSSPCKGLQPHIVGEGGRGWQSRQDHSRVINQHKARYTSVQTEWDCFRAPRWRDLPQTDWPRPARSCFAENIQRYFGDFFFFSLSLLKFWNPPLFGCA